MAKPRSEPLAVSLGCSYTISAATEMIVEMLRGWRAWHSRAKALTLPMLAGRRQDLDLLKKIPAPERISCRDASPRLSSRQL